MIKKSVTLLSFVILLISCEKSDLPTFNPVITEPVPVAFPCSGGMAGIYPCHISLDSLNGLGISGNDCWGWVDPNTQKEYALMCTSVGTSFIDITDGINPIVLGHLPTNTVNSIWRDVKTYGTFALIVSEASNHGMQVFDLTKLRDIDITNAPVTFSADAVFNIRFNDKHSSSSLKNKLNKIFKSVTKANKSRFKITYEVSGEAFLTKPNIPHIYHLHLFKEIIL